MSGKFLQYTKQLPALAEKLIYNKDISHVTAFEISKLSSLFLLSAAAFSIPFKFRPTTFLLISFGIFSLFHFFSFIKKIPRVPLYYSLIFVAFYLFYCLSFFHSSDQLTGFRDLETKFSLFALPVLILCLSKITKIELRWIFYSFLAGLITAEMLALAQAAEVFLESSQTDQFFYHDLVSFSDINAAYFSWYVLFSIVILLFFEIKLKKSISVILLCFQIIFLFLLSSRAVELSLLLLVIPLAIYRHQKKNPSNKKSAIYKFFIYLIVLASFAWKPGIFNQKFDKIEVSSIKFAFLPCYNHHSYDFNNINTRLFFWRVGFDNLKHINLLSGAGNGDINKLQNLRMHQLGILDIFNEKKPSDFLNMNLHNMYLQSLMATGIFGLLLFLSMLILPIVLAVKTKNTVLLLFQLLAALFMLHESALQTQSGVVFYSFFSALLIKQTLNPTNIKNARTKY